MESVQFETKMVSVGEIKNLFAVQIGLNVDEPSGSQDKPEPAQPASNLGK